MANLIICMDGGLITDIITDDPAAFSNIQIRTLDYDTDGGDADNIVAIPQDSGRKEDAYLGLWEAQPAPDFVARVIEAEAKHTAELAEADGSRVTGRAEPEPDAWFTVIDQNGNQRGQFLSEAAAQAYLDSAPKFLDRARSQIKRLES